MLLAGVGGGINAGVEGVDDFRTVRAVSVLVGGDGLVVPRGIDAGVDLVEDVVTVMACGVGRGAGGGGLAVGEGHFGGGEVGVQLVVVVLAEDATLIGVVVHDGWCCCVGLGI